MTEHERDEDVREERRRRVKVTDKRRTRDTGDSGDAAPGAQGGSTPPADAAAPEPGRDQAAARAGSPEDAEPSATFGSAQDEIEEARARAAEYLEDLQRLKAEFENYRKRILKEQTRALEMASESLVGRLLEVLDEFELALVAAEHERASQKFVHGVEMVYAKLLDILRAEGLERIEAEGKPFDPELHEALLQSDGGQEGEPYVEDVLRTGYILKGRVIRPAGVKVGRR